MGQGQIIKNDTQSQGGISRIMSLGKVIGGAITGNPAMIADGTSGLNPSSPLGKAAGLYSQGSNMAGFASSLGAGSQGAQGLKMPEIGEEFKGNSPDIGGSAMDRALQDKQQDVNFHVKNAMGTLMNNSPEDLGISPDMHAHLYEGFARLHHFGPGGGLDQIGNEGQ